MVAGEEPVVVKLEMEYGSVLDMNDVLQIREVMVRTGNDRCTSVI